MGLKMRTKLIAIWLLCLMARSAQADPATIVAAKANAVGSAWTFSVTLNHGDTGWDDYADGWRVVGPDGHVLGTRTLFHPHVNEQPFTRSLSNVEVPGDMNTVFIEASTNVEGWGKTRFPLKLPR